jgi:SAM-dependent methyltransferase
MRYQGQAAVIVSFFGGIKDSSLKDFARSSYMTTLSIYEPGVSGPFRKILRNSGCKYENSFYWPDVLPGEIRENVVCQNLESLTYPDEKFDLVITSDIFEHIRNPLRAFKEVLRVLVPGGIHVFTVPMPYPWPRTTRIRVDTLGPQDVLLMEPRYHGDGAGGRALVYTDFGLDLLEQLTSLGGEAGCLTMDPNHPIKKKIATFYCRKLLKSI